MSAPPDLEAWIRDIKSHDPLKFEGAYHDERPRGPAVVLRLIREMQTASHGYTRGKFIELLGELGDTSAIPSLIAELRHSDQNVRQWAVTALRQLGGTAAEEAIRDYERTHPDEFV
jgi:HEAT repeat protein